VDQGDGAELHRQSEMSGTTLRALIRAPLIVSTSIVRTSTRRPVDGTSPMGSSSGPV
jgi:hypothetical protein